MLKNTPTETRFIFVMGGVCSGLGKGIASASVGALLKASGVKVFVQKLDPYLNVDPGTMSPFQHGEVFVTDDGAETDLDLGHYERFIDIPLSRLSTLTTGRVYLSVIERERKGDYAGKTIQIVPHITDEIKHNIYEAANTSKADVVLVEIGGTVGDIEGQPYLEAIRQIRQELGYHRTAFVLLTLLPYLMCSKEVKTKPTQLAVKELRSIGIHPDFILARADLPLKQDHMDKIALFCDVKPEAVISAPTVSSIYSVPLNFAKQNLHELLIRQLKLKAKKADLKEWEALNRRIKKTKTEIKIGLAGKYNGLEDAYLSVVEAIKAAAGTVSRKAKIIWIDTEKIEKNDKTEWKKARDCAGLLVPGGFGTRGIEGKIAIAKYCRENEVPYLGLCLGSQILAIEFARNVAGIKRATSEEFDAKAEHKVVHYLPGQNEKTNLGGTLRLGAYPCVLKKCTLAHRLYNQEKISERHRHRYEFNQAYAKQLEAKGLVFSGLYEKRKLAEIVEIKDHPFMIGSQFHPEFQSRPFRAHPLFTGFLRAGVKNEK